MITNFKPGQLVKLNLNLVKTPRPWLDHFEAEDRPPLTSDKGIYLDNGTVLMYIKSFSWENRTFAVVLFGDVFYEVLESNLACS